MGEKKEDQLTRFKMKTNQFFIQNDMRHLLVITDLLSNPVFQLQSTEPLHAECKHSEHVSLMQILFSLSRTIKKNKLSMPVMLQHFFFPTSKEMKPFAE